MIKKVKKLLFSNLSTKQTIFKNTFWLFFAEGICKILSFFITIIVARYLGAEGYGKFSFAFAYVAIFAIITDFGFNILTIREIAKNRGLAKKYIDNIAVMKLILGGISLVMIVLIMQFVGKSPEVKQIVYLAGIWMLIQSFTQFFQSIFRAFERMEYEAASKIVYSAVLSSFTFLVIWQKLGLRSLMQSYLYAALVGFIITLFMVRKNFAKFWVEFDFRLWKKILKEAWSFAMTSIFVIIYFKIDTIMLSSMVGDRVVGWYNGAYNLVFALLLIPEVIMGAAFPRFSRLYRSSKDKFARICRRYILLMISLSLLIGSLVFILAKWIILTIYGYEYLPSIAALQILIFAVMIVFVSYLFADILNVVNKQVIYTSVAGICVPINIILNYVMIPKASYIGAAAATVITEFIGLVLLFAFSSKYFLLDKRKLSSPCKLKIVTTSWDDGHHLDMRLAALLKKYGIKGTFYISPKNKEMNTLLSNKEIKELSKSFDMGAHTLTHPNLKKLSREEAYNEIKGSKVLLEKITGKKVKMFCYPGGEYDKKIKDITKKSEFIGARTVKPFVIDYPSDSFELGTTMHVYPTKRVYSNLKLALKNNIRFIPFIFAKDWKKIAMKTFDYVNEHGGIWHLWGHSWEIEKFSLWGDLEEILKYVSKKKSVRYLTNSEILEFRE